MIFSPLTLNHRRQKLDEVEKHETLPPHPNCVQFHRAWEERQHLYIQTELCQMRWGLVSRPSSFVDHLHSSSRNRGKRLSVGVIYHVNDKDELFPDLCALSLHYAEVEGVASFSLPRLSTLLRLITHVVIYNYHHSTKLYWKISRVCCRLYCYECVSSFRTHCHCLVIMLKWKESLVSGW